jgi:hypothetical protein
VRSKNEVARLLEDVVMESDRTFFRQHPERDFRVRPMWDIELEEFACHGGPLPFLITGWCWWAAIRQLEPGLRARFPFPAPHNFPTELSEDNASEVFFRVIGVLK